MTPLTNRLREQAQRLADLGVADDVRLILQELADDPHIDPAMDLGRLGPLRLLAAHIAHPQHATLSCPDCGHHELKLIERQEVTWLLDVEPRPAGWQLFAHAYTRQANINSSRHVLCGRCEATWTIDDLTVEWR